MFVPASTSTCEVEMFADDTSMHTSAKTTVELESKLNSDLEHVNNWCLHNKMCPNTEKSKCMLVTTRQKRTHLASPVLNVKIGDNDIENVEFEKNYNIDDVKRLLTETPGCKLVDEHVDGGYITPLEAQDDFKTYISRVRKDRSNEKALNMWIVSDNLLKGAALNSAKRSNCSACSICPNRKLALMERRTTASSFCKESDKSNSKAARSGKADGIEKSS